jgi:hypothetical protein
MPTACLTRLKRMSSLLALKVPAPERIVQVSDSEGFAVRGLSPHQVFSLYKRHTGELSALFDRIMVSVRDKGEADHSDIESVVLALVADAPTVLSELIVLGSGGDADDAENFEQAFQVAQQLTLPVQVDALTKIGELTFTSDMPPGKFATLVIGMAHKVTGAIQTVSRKA